MRIAVTSTVVFDVPDEDDLEALRQRFYDAHVFAIGKPMQTVTGQPWIMRAIERLEIGRRLS
jgi:hypothetical protein